MTIVEIWKDYYGSWFAIVQRPVLGKKYAVLPLRGPQLPDKEEEFGTVEEARVFLGKSRDANKKLAPHKWAEFIGQYHMEGKIKENKRKRKDLAESMCDLSQNLTILKSMAYRYDLWMEDLQENAQRVRAHIRAMQKYCEELDKLWFKINCQLAEVFSAMK